MDTEELSVAGGRVTWRRFTPRERLMRFSVSLVMVAAVVWSLLFVAVFGPGALAGTIAIAFRYSDARG